MRIGVIGKGGSGKTSLSWMLMQTAQHHGHTVYGLDADYNQHLAGNFGISNDTIPALADQQKALIDYVIGQRTDVTPERFNKTMLPTELSRLVGLNPQDPYLKDFMKPATPHTYLLRVGEFNAEDKGVRCYHVRTAVADIVLSHLKPLDKNDVLVVDFTAGVDPFASPIYLKLDALVLSVEPTLKGAEVAKQWRHLLADAPVPLMIVANKVTHPDDVTWLQDTIQPETVQASLLLDPAMRRIERGEVLSWSDLHLDNQAALSTLWQKLLLSRSAQNDNKRQELLQDIAQKRASAGK